MWTKFAYLRMPIWTVDGPFSILSSLSSLSSGSYTTDRLLVECGAHLQFCRLRVRMMQQEPTRERATVVTKNQIKRQIETPATKKQPITGDKREDPSPSRPLNPFAWRLALCTAIFIFTAFLGAGWSCNMAGDGPPRRQRNEPLVSAPYTPVQGKTQEEMNMIMQDYYDAPFMTPIDMDRAVTT